MQCQGEDEENEAQPEKTKKKSKDKAAKEGCEKKTKRERKPHEPTAYGVAKKAFFTKWLGLLPAYASTLRFFASYEGDNRRQAAEDAWQASNKRKKVLAHMPLSEQRKRRFI